MRLENGLTTIQVLTLIRGTLERFSKEIKRSIEYYVSEIGGEAVSEAYLSGGGACLKNLDRYLSEELNLPVKRMDIPKRIGLSDISVPPEDSLSIAGAIGTALGTPKTL